MIIILICVPFPVFLSGYNLHFLLGIFKMLFHLFYIRDMHVYSESPMTDALQLVRFASCFYFFLCASGLVFVCMFSNALIEPFMWFL